jgi:predicted adenylyl cyclase CyaB
MTYEIEIKSLLGTKDKADALRAQLIQRGEFIGKNKQLNHYFEKGDLQKLFEEFKDVFNSEAQEKLKTIISTAKTYSLRTREANGKVLLVLKVTLGDSSSENGISRAEFESEVLVSLEALDEIILSIGFTCQAKWSREREEFQVGNKIVTIDKNAGYGYLAEVEEVVTDSSDIERATSEIYSLMSELGLEELDQDRLARMFAHYNANWQEYYGTDKTFVVE